MQRQGNSDTPQQAEFREFCREWLAMNTPRQPEFQAVNSGIEIVTEAQLEYYSQWQKSAYEAGLIGCDYPIKFGGGGRTGCQLVANQEMLRAKTPPFAGAIGLGMAAPVLFFHGSDDLKQRFLPKLFSGEELWCQGFSEPGAGSDLASVQTTAVPKGKGKWVINGHKVWTSTAQFARWMILLARTDRSDKYNGLTYFVVPIESELGKSVTVRPLIKMTGEAGFNEVLFDDLEIDDAYRVDEVGKGWAVAMTTLAHERGAGALVSAVAGGQQKRATNQPDKTQYPLIRLARTCIRNGAPAIEDPVIRDKVMAMLIRQTAIKQHRRLRGVPSLADPQRLSLQDKLIGTEYTQDAAALALEIEGSMGTLSHYDDQAPEQGEWPLAYLSSFMGTIAGGTSEIQKNILGERVLGLAKSK